MLETPELELCKKGLELVFKILSLENERILIQPYTKENEQAKDFLNWLQISLLNYKRQLK